jgi:hypothetical protein
MTPAAPENNGLVKKNHNGSAVSEVRYVSYGTVFTT